MWSMIHFSHFESIEVGSLLELKQCLHWEKKQLSPLGVSKRSKTPSNTLLEYISLKYHAVLGHPGILRGKNMVDSQFSSSDGLIVPDLDIYQSVRARRLLRV